MHRLEHKKAGVAGRAGIWVLWFITTLFLLGAGDRVAAAGEADAAPPLPDGIYKRLAAGERVKPETLAGKKKPEQPTVYLTFDDGPSKLTPEVLDILAEEEVKGTFFVIGQLVEEQKELTRRIAEEGHALGNHTYNHVYKELYGSFSEFWKQVQKAEEVLEAAAGVKPTLFRAPGGTHMNFDSIYFYQMEQAGYSIFDWNVDSGDAKRRGVPAEEILETVRRTPLQHEMVVLMHDGTGHEETVKALPGIIRFYKEKGYAFAALSEDVEPVQFRLGSVQRWNRQSSPKDFAADYKLAWEAGARRVASAPVAQPKPQPPGKTGPIETRIADSFSRERPLEDRVGAVLDRSGDAIRDALLPRGSLTVSFGGAPWVLEAGSYELSMGRVVVPLRGLVQRMGGQVEWNEETFTATVSLGAKTVEYDPVRGVVVERVPGAWAKTRYLADIRLKDGEIRIPLKATAELLGGRVGAYQPLEERPLVQVSLGGTRMTAYWEPEFRFRLSSFSQFASL